MFLPYKGPDSLPIGVYRWKVGTLSFLGRNRIRGAGFKDVTSPSFDHWNGYEVTVPKGLMYQEVEPAVKATKFGAADYRCIEVEGLEPMPCPFCKAMPQLDFKGQWAVAGPMNAERWYLKCCVMINSVGFSNSKVTDLIEFWNSKVENV